MINPKDVTISIICNKPEPLKFTVDWIKKNSGCEGFKIMFVYWDNAPKETLDWIMSKTAEEEIPPSIAIHEHNPEKDFVWNLYQCWNKCITDVKTEYAIPLGDDYYGNKDWLKNLLDQGGKDKIVCPLLIERGVMPSHHPTKDFGIFPNIQTTDFQIFANSLQLNLVREIPEYLAAKPYLVSKETYKEMGGEPDQIKDGVTGDQFFIRNAISKGIKLLQVRNSIIYHSQAGAVRVYG